MFKIVLLLFISVILNADDNYRCQVENKIMKSILIQEAHVKRKPGYKYLISFNKKDEAKHVRRFLPQYFIDRRTIDCKDLETCRYLTEKLLRIGIVNLDLGCYQINPIWHKHETDKYFSFVDSYKIACAYQEKMVRKYGYNWFAFASYNSQTPENNLKYQKSLIKIYFSLKDGSFNDI